MRPDLIMLLEFTKDLLLHHRGRLGEFVSGPESDPELSRLLVEDVVNHDADFVQVELGGLIEWRFRCGVTSDLLVELDQTAVMFSLLDIEILI